MEWLCVFCGSSAGEDSRYLDSAEELGRTLVREGIGLVYGGSRMGLMGRLAHAVLEEGGRAIGVIPEALVNREVAHGGLTELRVVASMHERKAMMQELSDAFLALPGGLGTVEEFMEVVTWSQLGLHRKPCGVLDVRGYFQPFIEFLDHAVREGFVLSAHRRMVIVEKDIPTLLRQLRSYEPPSVPRWIGAGDT